jgi:hypothetical protein
VRDEVVGDGSQPAEGLSSSDAELIHRLENYGLAGLAAEVARRLKDADDEAAPSAADEGDPPRAS